MCRLLERTLHVLDEVGASLKYIKKAPLSFVLLQQNSCSQIGMNAGTVYVQWTLDFSLYMHQVNSLAIGN